MAEKFKISNLDLYYGTERLRKIHLFEEFKQNERSGRGM